MARSSVLGNGNTAVCLDNFSQVRDFYFPYVGQDNHIASSQVHKIGVFCDKKMHWLDNGEWQTSIDYEDATLVSASKSVNKSISINLESRDAVYNEKNIFLRKFTITNTGKYEKEIGFILNQQFKIGDTNHADTAYFSSTIESVVHYKGRRVFLVGGLCDNKPFDEYSIGFCGVEGKEGTWRDAEDGVLSKNPIEHGIVDSVISWKRKLAPGESKVVYYWITVGETYREVCDLLNYVFQKSPEHLLESTDNYWRAWVNQTNYSFVGLSAKTQKLFYNSLLIMRAQTDNRGGILASADSGNIQYGGDTYIYVWPRDAAFSAWSFDLAGFPDLSKKFYDFAKDVLTEEGFVLHKYQPDRSLGSSWHPWVKDDKRQLAIQEDETAILLFGLWEHYIRAKDLEFIESLYNPFIKRAADFLVRYKDNGTKLPLSSYDLWEERYGVSAYTAGAVYGGLQAAARFAKILGKEEESELYSTEAKEIREAILQNLWDDNQKIFINLVQDKNNLIRSENVDASSFYGIFRFGVLQPDEPRMIAFYKNIVARLGVGGRGLARYEGDLYCRVSDKIPGNPWFVCLLWLTQYKIQLAKTESELSLCAKDLEWVASMARSSMLSEQINFSDGSQISATPLVWSHAEFVHTLIEYDKKYQLLVKTYHK